jgi:hypothetical protein
VHEDGEQSEKFDSKVVRIILASFTCSRKPESQIRSSTGRSQSVYWLGCRLDSFHFSALLSCKSKTDKRHFVFRRSVGTTGCPPLNYLLLYARVRCVSAVCCRKLAVLRLRAVKYLWNINAVKCQSSSER